MSPSPEITVVVPARNAAATIEGTLAALAAQEIDVAYEVVVVDSGSTDGTREIVCGCGGATALLENPSGEPAGSRNLGVRHGTASVLAFTDADCEPTPSWLACGLQALQRADIVQGRVVPVHPPGLFDRTIVVSGEHGLYETANLFIRREVFDRVGGFEPVVADEFSPFGEDAWFVWRARREGFSTAFAAEVLVYHAVFPRGLREYVAERSRTRFFPPLVVLIPELRRHFLHRRIFLTPQSARFDLLLVGLATGALTRRRSPAVAALASYAADLTREVRRGPSGEWPRIVLGRLASDAMTLAGLVRGSAKARTLVL